MKMNGKIGFGLILLIGLFTALFMMGQGIVSATTLFSDNFDDGNATGWSATSGTWSVVSDSGSYVYYQSSTNEGRTSAGSSSWTNYSVEARVKVDNFNGSNRAYVCGRWKDANNFYCVSLYNSSGGTIEIRKKVNGSTTNLATLTNVGLSAGTWYTVKLAMNGTSLTAYLNGVQKLTATDSALSSGAIGLIAYKVVAKYDDVAVNDFGTTTPTPTAVATATPTGTKASATPTPTGTRATATPTPTSPTNTATPTPTAVTGVIHVTTSGTDSGSGTTSSPMSLTAAITRVAAGGTIYVHSGTYSYSTGITIAYGNNGSSSAFKKLTAAPGENAPILNFSAQTFDSANRGLTLNGNYWLIKGIKVTGAGDNGIYIGGSYNVIQDCATYANRDSGLQLGRRDSSLSSINDWPSYNLILNCESYDNRDPDNGEDADGFACKLTTGYGNVFRGCIAHNNIDDGWDLYTKSDTGVIGPVVIEDCIAYSNGMLSDGSTMGDGDGNGFKLGSSSNSVQHIVRRCMAFYNKKHGFTDNSNPGPITVKNCTSWHNSMTSTTSQSTSNYNFAFSNGTHNMSNNLSYVGGGNDHYTTGSDLSNSNVWWNKDKQTATNATGTITATAADFSSAPSYTFGVSPVSRNSDGSINYGSFFQLVSGSDLVNAGVSGYTIGTRGNVDTTKATMPYTLP